MVCARFPLLAQVQLPLVHQKNNKPLFIDKIVLLRQLLTFLYFSVVFSLLSLAYDICIPQYSSEFHVFLSSPYSCQVK